MKFSKRIRILGIIVFLLVLGIGIGQLLTLRNIREQVAMGLRSGLNDIAHDLAQDIGRRYEDAIRSDLHRLIPSAGSSLPPQQTYSRQWQIAIEAMQLAESWFLATPDSSDESWNIQAFFPARGSQQASWRRNTPMGRILSQQLALKYDHWSPEARSYWETTIDSTLLLYYQENSFSSISRFACHPVFDNQEEHLLAFVCVLIPQHKIEEKIIRIGMEAFFSAQEKREDGIQRQFLSARMKDQNGRIYFQSSLLSSREYEASVSMDQISQYLGLLEVDIGFLGKNSAEVAASLHRRNVWLVLGVFAVLLILMALFWYSFLQSQRLQQLKTDFVANITHELKTPLAAITLANDTIYLGRYQNEAQMRRSLDIIREEGKKLDLLLSRLLDYSQLESGKKAYHKQAINIQELWNDWFSSSQMQVSSREVSLICKTPVPNGWIPGDPEAIKDVFNILIDNAIKYSGASKLVNMYHEENKGSWHVIVEDFGIGIAAGDQQIIFDKFVRLEDAEVHTTKGYGLGLSIAKSILEAHDGHISVESTPNKGSRFHIFFPLNSLP